MEEALAKWEADCLAKELATKAAEDKTKMTEILYTEAQEKIKLLEATIDEMIGNQNEGKLNL